MNNRTIQAMSVRDQLKEMFEVKLASVGLKLKRLDNTSNMGAGVYCWSIILFDQGQSFGEVSAKASNALDRLMWVRGLRHVPDHHFTLTVEFEAEKLIKPLQETMFD